MIAWRAKTRPSWVQWTALGAVGLTLAAAVRPAYGMTSIPAPVLAPATAQKSEAPATTGRTRAAPAGARPRLRARVSPVRVHVMTAAGPATFSTDDPWALFDGDA